MSVVVAIKNGDYVYMGTDSMTSMGNDKVTKLEEKTFKITKFSNGVLIGVCGRVGAHQELCAHPEIFEFEGERLTKKEVVLKIVPKVKKILEENNWVEKSDGDMLISIVLAYKGDLYKIHQNGDCISISTCIASGAGDEYAMYSLLDETKSIRERILNALNISSKNCDSVGKPFVLIDTEKLEYEIVEEVC